jgi:glycosyltransferase 2 family protein
VLQYLLGFSATRSRRATSDGYDRRWRGNRGRAGALRLVRALRIIWPLLDFLLPCGDHGRRKTSDVLKRLLHMSTGAIVSVIFVYLAVRKVDLSESLRVLETVRLVPLGAAAVAYLSAFPVRALRWRLVLQTQKMFSWKEILAPVFVGYMANNLLPARTGEIYRTHFLGRRAQVSRTGVAASIVVERTFDGLMLVVVMLLVLVLFPHTTFLSAAAFVTGSVFLVLATLILLHSFAVDESHRLVSRGLTLLPRVLRERLRDRPEVFLRGIRGISTARDLTVASGYTVCIWLLEACAIALVLASFRVSLPLDGFILVYALVALSTTLPSGPGYVGPYQYAFVLSLGAFSISSETALAVSLAAQLAFFGSVTAIGLALLWREQLRSVRYTNRTTPAHGDESESRAKKDG